MSVKTVTRVAVPPLLRIQRPLRRRLAYLKRLVGLMSRFNVFQFFNLVLVLRIFASFLVKEIGYLLSIGAVAPV